jgi:hypothetical protein
LLLEESLHDFLIWFHDESKPWKKNKKIFSLKENFREDGSLAVEINRI